MATTAKHAKGMASERYADLKRMLEDRKREIMSEVHEKIREIPLLIDCSGRFAQVHEFLRNVERLPATVWIESIKIENMKDNAKNVTCKVNLVGFSARGATAGPTP